MRLNLFSAIRLASKVHTGQWRFDGNEYIEHPLSVLSLLWELSLDLPMDVYIAAVLHDVLEDTDLTYEDLYERVGNDIAAVVRVLTKDEVYYNLPEAKRERMYLQRIQSLSIHFPYALLIKMIDRLHNVRTSRFLTPQKRNMLLNQTMQLYIPILHDHISTLSGPIKEIYSKCEDQLQQSIEVAGQISIETPHSPTTISYVSLLMTPSL